MRDSKGRWAAEQQGQRSSGIAEQQGHWGGGSAEQQAQRGSDRGCLRGAIAGIATADDEVSAPVSSLPAGGHPAPTPLPPARRRSCDD